MKLRFIIIGLSVLPFARLYAFNILFINKLDQHHIIKPQLSNSLCSKDAELANKLLNVGSRLGVSIETGQPKLQGKDASYLAHYGKLGTITFLSRPMKKEVRCKLISHEFIHVLQHIKGDLKGVEPLGWPVSKQSIEHFGSIQEAEAYTYQNQVGLVYRRLLEVESGKH